MIRVSAPQPIDMRARRTLYLLLQTRVQRGEDAQAAPVHQRRTKLVEGLVEHIEHEMRGDDIEAAAGRLQPREDIISEGGACVRGSDITLLHHCLQHQRLALPRHLRSINRIQPGRLRNGSEQRALSKIKFSGRLREIHPRGRINPVGKMAVEIGVQIPLQDFLFAVAFSRLSGDERLAKLARITGFGRAARRDYHVLHQLLRDGTAALYLSRAGFRTQHAGGATEV